MILKDEGFYVNDMNTIADKVKDILGNGSEEALRAKVACREAGQIAALADMAGVTISPLYHMGKIHVLMEGKGEGSVNAFVKRAAEQLSLYVEGGEYEPLLEALEALKKRVYQEVLKIEGFVNEDYEFRFIDTNGVTTVPVEDWKALMRGRIYRLEPDPDSEEGGFVAFPEL